MKKNVVEQLAMGQRLKEARKAKGISLQTASDKAQITLAMLSRYEHGLNEIRASRLRTLCDLYGVTYEWVLTGHDTQVQSPEFQQALAHLEAAAKEFEQAASILKE